MIRLLVVMMMGLAAGLAFGQDTAVATGQNWRDWSFTMRNAFARGFGEGYIEAFNQIVDPVPPTPVPARTKKVAQTVVCMGNMNISQVVAIMDKYVADHPEKWDKGINELFGAAITQACAERDAR